MNSPTIEAIADWLRNLPADAALLIAAHVRPDGDAAGSIFGLLSTLRDNGYTADAIFPGDIPDGYDEILELPEYYRHADEVNWKNYHYLLALDTSNPERLDLGCTVDEVPIPIIVIDHHADNKRYGAENFVMAAPSASDIVYRACVAANFTIPVQAATAFLGGLVRDTGCFRFANTDAVAFRCAAALVTAGADYPAMINTLFFQRPLNEMQCFSELIARHLTFYDNDTVAVLFADPAVFEQYKLTLTNTDALIDEVRAIRGVEIIVLFYLLDNGKYKASFRSKVGERPIAAVARALGGGGHEMAASCVFDADSPQAATERILAEILKK